MSTPAIYLHHERVSTALLEADLQIREIGIDPVLKMLSAYSATLSTILHAVTQESPAIALAGTLSLAQTLAVTGAVTLSSTLTTVGSVTVGLGASGNGNLSVNKADGFNSTLLLTTAGLNRWAILSNATAETGSNAGSNFQLDARTDAGGALDNVIFITRAAGGSITLNRPLIANSTLGVVGILTATAIGFGITSAIQMVSTTPSIGWSETDRGTNNKNWDIVVSGGQMLMRSINDANSSSNTFITATRGATVAIADLAFLEAGNTGTYTFGSTGLASFAGGITVAGVTTVTGGLVFNGGATNLNYYETGTFTATLTGCTAAITCTATYTRVGRIVTVNFNSAFTGTSNSTACTITGEPTSIRPSSSNPQRCPVWDMEDNSAFHGGALEPQSGGGYQVYYQSGLTAQLSSSFTASGTKGLLNGATITYQIF